MSRPVTETIRCPECGKESEFVIWTSVNTMIDPELKEKVKNGDLFCFKCPECSRVTYVNYSLLYHQMEDQLMIYYVADREEIPKVEKMLLGMESSTADLIGDALPEYTKRIVATIPELMEKISIFDAGLDDRIIEIMKLFYYVKLGDEDKRREISEIQFYVTPEGEKLFLFQADGKTFASAEFQKELYDMLVKEYTERVQSHSEQDLIIDLDWAMRAMRD